jgi:hypothetical protein
LSLLQAIAELPNDALHRGLAHLQAAEFLYETSLFPERVYTFKHALTHEVAYGGSSRSGAGRCIRTLLRPSRLWRATAWRTRSNGWRNTLCGAKCGRKPWSPAGRQETKPEQARPTGRP